LVAEVIPFFYIQTVKIDFRWPVIRALAILHTIRYSFTARLLLFMGVYMNHWINTVYSDSGAAFVSNPTPQKGETITIRIRMLRNTEIRHVYLRLKEFGVQRLIPMTIEKEKNNLLYYKTDIVCNEAQIQYQFYLATDSHIYYYTQYRITDYIPEESRDFVILTDYKRPAWIAKSVGYQIMADRFRNGRPELTVKTGEYSYQGYSPIQITDWNTEPLPYEKSHCMDFYGGDLYGIIEKLDYLQKLGVTVLYLNPLFTAPTMHKYDCLDYFHIDPHLGGDEGLALLCKKLHERGMRIIMDISINHTSSASKWFNKTNEFYPSEQGAYQNKNSIERQYYFIDENGAYDTWAGVETMPTLNYTSKHLRDAIYLGTESVLKKWMRPPYSIDGWRFDVADCMARNVRADCYHEVWTEINRELKALNPELLILAEDWGDCSALFNGTEWDSTMNYFGSARPLRAFAGERDLLTAREPLLAAIPDELTAEQLANRITDCYAVMPTAMMHQMFNLLDSHDVSRLHNNPIIHYDDYRGAVMTLFGLPGMASIYYGDEVFLAGRINDIEGCRFPMDWNYPMIGRKQETFELYCTLSALKKSSNALQQGGFKVIYARGKVFAFARFTEDEAVLFFWSVSAKDESVSIDAAEFGVPEKEVRLCFGSHLRRTQKGTELHLTLTPHQSAVLHIGT